MLFVYYLVTALGIETGFNRKSSDKRKCINLKLKLKVVKTIIDYQTEDLQSIYQFLNTKISI